MYKAWPGTIIWRPQIACKAARFVSRYDNVLPEPDELLPRCRIDVPRNVGCASRKREQKHVGELDQWHGAPTNSCRPGAVPPHHGKRDTNPNAMPWRPLRDGDILKNPDWRSMGVKTCQNAMYGSNMAIELSLSHLSTTDCEHAASIDHQLLARKSAHATQRLSASQHWQARRTSD